MNSPNSLSEGLSLLQKGMHTDAECVFTQILASCPDDPAILYYRGLARLRLQKLSDALEDFTFCLLQSPDHAAALAGQGSVHFRARHFDTAMECFKKADQCGGTEDGEFLFEMGLCSVELHQLPDAIPFFERYLIRHPEEANAWANIAHCQDEQGFYPEAIRASDAALSVDRSCKAAWFNKAVAHAHLHHHSQAHEAVREFLKLADASDAGSVRVARSLRSTLELILSVPKQHIRQDIRPKQPVYPAPVGTPIRGSEYRTGDPIGPNWIILGRLGMGEDGSSVRVFNKRDGSYAALKRLPLRFIDSTIGRPLLYRAAATWYELGKHPHILIPHRMEERDGNICMFQPLHGSGTPDGPSSLADRLSSVLPDPVQVLRFGIQFCEAMEYATDTCGLTGHYDLKPTNVFIDADGNVKLSDFSLAYAYLKSGVPETIDTSGVMVLPPTPDLAPFVPPERFHCAALDIRSDIYSFGILLHLFAHGKHPLLAQHARGSEDPSWHWEDVHLDALRPDPQDRIGAVVFRCLATTPGDRYASFEDIRRELLDEFNCITGHSYVPAPLVEYSPDMLYHHSITISAIGRVKEAKELCKRAMTADPLCCAAAINMGFNLGNTPLAAYYYRRVILLGSPYAALAWNNLGTIRMAQERHHEALLCYEEAIQIDPGYSNAWCNRASSLQALGQKDPAREAFQRSTTIDKRQSRAWILEAELTAEQDQLTDSIESLRQSTEAQPEFFWTWCSLALTLAKAGKFEEALTASARALLLDGTVRELHRMRAAWFNEIGNTAGVIAELRAYAEKCSPGERAAIQRLIDGMSE